MNKQQLAAKIWESANQMRSKIEANEYKDYILGFIFYKYLSDTAVKFARKEGGAEADPKTLLCEDDAEIVQHFKSSIGYFIAYNDLFSTWIAMGKDFDVSHVRDALSAFNRHINPAHKKVFEGIFKTLETGLSKLGENAASQTKAISALLQLIKDIPMDGKQDYDVLGFIYEYLISMFAANAGKKAGEFYTPHEVSLLMSELIAHHVKNKKQIQIYDPTSGSGSLLINIGNCVAKHMADENNIKYFAQELKQNTYNLTRMNLVMRGILVDNIVTRNGDTLEADWPWFDENDPTNYKALYVDAVVSNPPYSQKWDPTHKENDPRYARFGLAPKSKADYAFLLHELFHLKPDGIMTIVLPHGVLFRGGEEGEIRKKLVEGNHIDAIIGLPANIFFGTSIPTVILVLKQKRTATDILIVDASKGFEKVGKNNRLRASDIKRIADTVIARQGAPRFAEVVDREKIRANDYNLNIPRYVDSSEGAESWDIYATMFGGIPKGELDALKPYWDALPGLRNALFTKANGPYANLKVKDVKQAIQAHAAVQEFVQHFATAFQSLEKSLKKRLLQNALSVNLAQEENLLGQDLFKRLAGIALIDPYAAYQILDDEWNKIAVDLEILQTEGWAAATQVDPNMVVKKKDGKETEVQEGWQGRVIPFVQVQETLLQAGHQKLQVMAQRLAALEGECDELLESFSDDEKESSCFNDEKSAFVPAELNREAKQLRAELKKNEAYAAESYEAKIIRVDDLLKEEKELKKQLKADEAALHLKTKAAIEALSEAQVHDLLQRKWIQPLVHALHQLPQSELASLSAKVLALAEKYATTYHEVVEQIRSTENTLSELIDQLSGNEHDQQGLAKFQQLLKGL
jgi:type I restriction enzyme M protein